MKRLSLLLIPALLALATPASADVCVSPTESAPTGPVRVYIIDTEVGTQAFERLEVYSNGGHSTLGRAVSQAQNWLGNCTYAGVGIGVGSGGNGYRPNITLWFYSNRLDATQARATVMSLIGAAAVPVVTNGDCAISCDGSFNRTNETTTTIATTTTVIPTTTTTIPVVVAQPSAAAVAPTPTTTTTTIAVVSASGRIASVAPTSKVVTRYRWVKRNGKWKRVAYRVRVLAITTNNG
jgi:hypothetical protein